MALKRRGLTNLGLSKVLSDGPSLAVTLFAVRFLGTTGRGQLALMFGIGNLGGALAFSNLHGGATSGFKRGEEMAVQSSIRIAWLASAITPATGLGVSLALGLRWFSFASTAEPSFSAIGASLVTNNRVVLRIPQGLADARGFRIAWTISPQYTPSLAYRRLGHRSSLPARHMLVRRYWPVHDGCRSQSSAGRACGRFDLQPRDDLYLTFRTSGVERDTTPLSHGYHRFGPLCIQGRTLALLCGSAPCLKDVDRERVTLVDSTRPGSCGPTWASWTLMFSQACVRAFLTWSSSRHPQWPSRR